MSPFLQQVKDVVRVARKLVLSLIVNKEVTSWMNWGRSFIHNNL